MAIRRSSWFIEVMRDWLLDSFPAPNPFFEAPPRRDDGWTWRGILCLAFIGAASTCAFALHLIGVIFLSWAAVLALFGVIAGFIGTPLAALDAMRRGGWRHGRIVPARVVYANRTSILLLLAHIALTPIAGIGLFLHLATGGVQFSVVETVVNGRLRRFHAKFQDAAPTQPLVWIALPGWFRPTTIVAQSYLVPSEADAWLKDAVARASNPFASRLRDYEH